MKTNQEHINGNTQESGNALIYVLIAVALFAALSMTLTRQTDSNEAEQLSEEKVALLATQIISNSAQVKSAIDQMLFSGIKINDLNFQLPSASGFDSGDVIYKVYHPQGGGVTRPRLALQARQQVNPNPPSGWYLGKFNNVEWTVSSGEEVILTAYQINRQVCEVLNEKITGTRDIPAISAFMSNTLVDDAFHTGSNQDLTTDTGDICPECKNMTTLCVSNAGATTFSFYTIIADQ